MPSDNSGIQPVKSVLVSTHPGSIPDLQLNVGRMFPQAGWSLFHGIAGNLGKGAFMAPFRSMCVKMKKTCWGRHTFPASGHVTFTRRK